MGSAVNPVFEVEAPKATFEVEPPSKPGMLDKANEYAGKALSAAGLPTSIENIPDWFKHLTGQAKDSEPFWEPIRKAIADPTQENLVAAVPFIGPSSVAMSKDVQAGNYGGAAATLAGTVAGPLAGGQVGPGLSAGKAELAQALRTPENKLTPIAKGISRVATGAAAHATGIPGGEIAGALSGIGPAVAEKIIPQRAPIPNFYGGAYEPPVQPFLGPETPTEAQFRRSAKLSDMGIAKAAAKKAQSEGTGVNVVPEPRGNFTGEVPGYMASVPRGTLEDLALAGKPGAAVQLQQLGKPIIYSSRGGDISNVKSSVKLSDLAPGKPEWAYRVRDVGEEGVPANATERRAHATTSLEDAQGIMQDRGSVTGKEQETVRYDLSKLKEGVDYLRHPREGQPDWIQMLRPVPESAIRRVPAR